MRCFQTSSLSEPMPIGRSKSDVSDHHQKHVFRRAPPTSEAHLSSRRFSARKYHFFSQFIFVGRMNRTFPRLTQLLINDNAVLCSLPVQHDSRKPDEPSPTSRPSHGLKRLERDCRSSGYPVKYFESHEESEILSGAASPTICNEFLLDCGQDASLPHDEGLSS